MGKAYLVEHPRLPRQDALKLLDTNVSRNEQFRSRFTREAELLAPLRHPNLVVIHDRGEHEGRLWLTMEYVDGKDAAQLVRERGPLPLPLVADIIAGAGAALDYAYSERGITHRDVKPANILVEFDRAGGLRSVKLADFGIAKAAGESASLTSTGMTIGTMSYISPEAIDGDELNNRADIYSLGCTAFDLLTGTPPYVATPVSALMMRHLSAPIPRVTDFNPALPATLNHVFARVLAKSPADRYATCGDFAVALRVAAKEAVVPSQSAPTISAEAPPLNRWAPATGAAAVPDPGPTVAIPLRDTDGPDPEGLQLVGSDLEMGEFAPLEEPNEFEQLGSGGHARRVAAACMLLLMLVVTLVAIVESLH